MPIKHTDNWELKPQEKQAKINKENTRKKIKRVYHYYKVGDKVMLNNNATLKYERLYTGIFEITKCCINGTVTLKYGLIINRYNIRQIKPYTSDTNVEGIIANNDV